VAPSDNGIGFALQNVIVHYSIYMCANKIISSHANGTKSTTKVATKNEL